MNPLSWTRKNLERLRGFFMAKLTTTDKTKIITLYKEGYGYRAIAKKVNISNFDNIRIIIKQYELFGEEALIVRHRDKKYSPEYKMDIIKRVLNGESISSVAFENMLSPGQLSNWIKKYKELGYNGLSKPKGRSKIMKPKTKKTKQVHEDEKDKRIRELEERNAQLEMENDLLKKLRALVQQRTQQPNKKK